VWPINDAFMMGIFTIEEKATAAGELFPHL